MSPSPISRLYSCKTSQLTEKPLANRTIEVYDYYFRIYLQKIKNHDDNARKAYDRLFTKTLVIFIVNTGLRAMELTNLKPEDVDLENGIVYVWLGKGNKNRKVGLTREILEMS